MSGTCVLLRGLALERRVCRTQPRTGEHFGGDQYCTTGKARQVPIRRPVTLEEDEEDEIALRVLGTRQIFALALLTFLENKSTPPLRCISQSSLLASL